MEAASRLKIILPCVMIISAVMTWWIARSRRNTAVSYQGKSREDDVCRIEEMKMSLSHSTPEQEERFRLYKELYFKLQHLENHPEIIPKAKSLLISFLSGAIQSAHAQQGSIIDVESFSPDALDSFTKQELDCVTSRWQQYLERRKDGQPRELFQGIIEAKWWLMQMAPTKYVDGAWLGHIHKIKTPFAYRSVTKDAWQVLSEELGDGDLDKNHVQVYAQLLNKIGVHLPAGNSMDFIQHRELNDVKIWQTALIQLLISLFPHEFLPEILGFNMHFEMLTFETIVAAKELRELGIDPYYFTLHITIDNADTGHATMAKEAVVRYLQLIKISEGDSAVQQAWKRVQAGYLLSKCTPLDLDTSVGVSVHRWPPSKYAKEVLSIFESKAIASSGIHDNCRASFGGRKLGAWLEPKAFKQKDWQMEFLHKLSNTKPWVFKGDSSRSRLIQLISWGGSMFGAFTHNEVATIRAWIGSLASQSSSVYGEYTGRPESQPGSSSEPDFHVDYPVFLPDTFDEISLGADSTELLTTNPLTSLTSNSRLDKLLPLWFAHPCLLESFISVPWQTTNQAGCAAVRFLRAQYGYGPETSEIAGMDEMRRIDSVDLIDIGLELVASLGYPSPKSLADVLKRWPSPFADRMLSLSIRPEKYRWTLLGLAQAFLHLTDALATSSSALSTSSRSALVQIAERERESMSILIGNMREGDASYLDFKKGYLMGRQEIEKALGGV